MKFVRQWISHFEGWGGNNFGASNSGDVVMMATIESCGLQSVSDGWKFKELINKATTCG